MKVHISSIPEQYICVLTFVAVSPWPLCYCRKDEMKFTLCDQCSSMHSACMCALHIIIIMSSKFLCWTRASFGFYIQSFIKKPTVSTGTCIQCHVM